MAELLIDYICAAQRLAGQLLRTPREEGEVAARASCLKLAGSGTNCGFDQITQSARNALRNLDCNQALDDTAASVERILAICSRLRCSRTVIPLPAAKGRSRQ